MKDWYFMAPDKPTRVGTAFFPHLNSEWIAEIKSDGFRCEAGRFNGKLHFISRVNKPLDVSDAMKAECAFIPEGCAIDAEFINPIRVKAINSQFGLRIPLTEKLIPFDITWYNGDYIGRSKTLAERRALDVFTNIPQGTLDSFSSNDRIFRTPWVSGEHAAQLFEDEKAVPICEGIVVKKLSSRCIGSRSASQDTSEWFKIKHRD